MTVTKDMLLAALPTYKDEWVLVHPDQSVKDIIKEELNAHNDFAKYYDCIACYFDDVTVKKICERLYNFCIDNLAYDEETEEFQSTSVPQGLLSRGHCDCKGYANFIGGVLDALNRQGRGIDWNYRFASYDLLNTDPHHVYIVVNDTDDNNNELWIDPTPGADKSVPTWIIDKKISAMALHRNIGSLGAMPAPATSPEDGIVLPENPNLVWLDGTWKVIEDGRIGAAKVGDLLDTGLAVITSLSSLFGSGGTASRAAQKIFQMFPIPPNATAAQVQQVINAVNTHYQSDLQGNLDSEWRAAYADILNQYGNVLKALQSGSTPPAIVVPPIAGSNMPAQVPSPYYPTTTSSAFNSSNLLLWGGLGLAAILILPKLLKRTR